MMSAPVVVGDTVIVGSAMADNQRVEAPHGTVRRFDARTGARRLGWDPVPRDAADPATATWGEGWRTAGHANVWAPMSADAARGLVFLPTSSPSPDFHGGLRPGSNLQANSVVALDAGSGRRLWHFQTVHHDVWDYYLASAPAPATLRPGTATFGGPLHTASGLLFIGATTDRYLRAFDAASGRELWFGRLPAAPMSTPASYEFGDRQYLVIAAGGYDRRVRAAACG